MEIYLQDFLFIERMDISFRDLSLEVLQQDDPVYTLSEDAPEYIDRLMTIPSDMMRSAQTFDEVIATIRRELPGTLATHAITEIQARLDHSSAMAKRAFYEYLLAEIFELAGHQSHKDSLKGFNLPILDDFKEVIDVYHIITSILNDQELAQVFIRAIPDFPFRADPDVVGTIYSWADNIIVLPGFVHGLKDYLIETRKSLTDATPEQINDLARKFGEVDGLNLPLVQLDKNLAKYVTVRAVERAHSTDSRSIGFLDAFEVLSNLK